MFAAISDRPVPPRPAANASRWARGRAPGAISPGSCGSELSAGSVASSISTSDSPSSGGLTIPSLVHRPRSLWPPKRPIARHLIVLLELDVPVGGVGEAEEGEPLA